jgi:hypothetical protein
MSLWCNLPPFTNARESVGTSVIFFLMPAQNAARIRTKFHETQGKVCHPRMLGFLGVFCFFEFFGSGPMLAPSGNQFRL